MTDLIVVDSGHSARRYDRRVAMQVISFLRHGRFERFEPVTGDGGGSIPWSDLQGSSIRIQQNETP